LNVYLVRHAIAEERDPDGEADDASRRLTPHGIDRMRQVVRGLTAIGVELDAIWTSPLKRARATADLLAELPGFDGEIGVVEALNGSGVHNVLIESIAAFDGGENLALVGHEPDLGDLASILVCGSPEGLFRFKKGGAACIELFTDSPSPIRGELRWFLTPKLLRRLA
jgi:phosphohistidine phosphatase